MPRAAVRLQSACLQTARPPALARRATPASVLQAGCLASTHNRAPAPLIATGLATHSWGVCVLLAPAQYPERFATTSWLHTGLFLGYSNLSSSAHTTVGSSAHVLATSLEPDFISAAALPSIALILYPRVRYLCCVFLPTATTYIICSHNTFNPIVILEHLQVLLVPLTGACPCASTRCKLLCSTYGE